MPKQDGHLTKQAILKVAEELFSKNGFDGTSVNRIAQAAGVNKSLIYYHFKNKNDLIRSLIEGIINEIEQLTESPADTMDRKALRHKNENVGLIFSEIIAMEKRKKIISVMLMESLKDSNEDSYLFDCAMMVVSRHLGVDMKIADAESRKRFVYEFFTGFIPIISFISLQDKLSKSFNYPIDQLRKDFFEALRKSHFQL